MRSSSASTARLTLGSSLIATLLDWCAKCDDLVSLLPKNKNRTGKDLVQHDTEKLLLWVRLVWIWFPCHQATTLVCSLGGQREAAPIFRGCPPRKSNPPVFQDDRHGSCN